MLREELLITAKAARELAGEQVQSWIEEDPKDEFRMIIEEIHRAVDGGKLFCCIRGRISFNVANILRKKGYKVSGYLDKIEIQW